MIKDEISGLIISSIHVHTYQETAKSDEEWEKKGKIEKDNGRPYSIKLNDLLGKRVHFWTFHWKLEDNFRYAYRTSPFP